MNIFTSERLHRCRALARLAEELEPQARRQLDAAGMIARMAAGTVVFRAGEACERYFLVLEGSVRVVLTGESGREILLYRVQGGQSCVLTTAGLMAGQPYEAEGIVEEETQALVIPAAAFHRLMDESAAFRQFVFSSFAVRLQTLIALIGEVAFSRLDRRLAALLLERSWADGVVRMTHQELAVELGSAREVVSRLLKSLEQAGLVKTARGQVRIVDEAGLRRVAQEA